MQNGAKRKMLSVGSEMPLATQCGKPRTEPGNWGPLSPSAFAQQVRELAVGTHPIPGDGFSSMLSISPPGPPLKLRSVSAPHTAPPAATSHTSTRSPAIPPVLAGILLHLFALPLPNCHSNPTEPAQSAFCATSSFPGTTAVTHRAGAGSTGTQARPPAGWPRPFLCPSGCRTEAAGSWEHPVWGWASQGVQWSSSLQAGFAGQQEIPCCKPPAPYRSLLMCNVHWT